MPSCLLEPIWVEFCALLGGERPDFDPAHPLGCHRRRVSDRVVFEHVVAALVHGSGYERIASPGCSDRTIRRRPRPPPRSARGTQRGRTPESQLEGSQALASQVTGWLLATQARLGMT